ncbi:Transcriptional regulatory protein ZraR [Botrimarina colliarenosi]|uniref:DNA-binding transcriptional regulator NtrC n=1 Tax=Botrimarina colliarenosi TaxID=2528001 RepID=A0A5C6ALX8_9BACT|nr:sigma-54 dependent transcriptional regulator [Botrimarina colliarenosi]TWU00650.1 Transcriptional regulatory protein ZraR [Botrimarina colliarenosi]
MPRVLAIDDDRTVHHLVSKVLGDRGVTVTSAFTAQDGLDEIERDPPDAVLLDVMLPDISGLEAVKLIRERDPRLPVIFVTAAESSDTAIEAMKHGAFDYLQKPIDLARLEELVDQAIESRRLANVKVAMHTLLKPDESGDAFIGRCAPMQEVFKSIGRVAPQDVPVLVRGESGTGKELVARALFQHGARSGGPFLAVNCAALSETLLESELFGHEKGSFTGAHERRIGKFEQCHGGTIFLDEVGDMSPLVQSKVLRLLQEQRFERVGGNQTIETDVRVISATNRDLEEMCEEGEFRLDLMYRLNGYTVYLPALSERGDDRILLLQHFLARFNRELGMEVQGIAPDALERLLAYDWPGNVREMQSVVKQSLLHCSGPVLLASALPTDIGPPIARRSSQGAPRQTAAPHESSQSPEPNRASQNGAADGFDHFVTGRLSDPSGDLYAEALTHMERRLLTAVLTHTGGNQSEASRILGITRGSLRNKIRGNGIQIGQTIDVAPSAGATEPVATAESGDDDE